MQPLDGAGASANSRKTKRKKAKRREVDGRRGQRGAETEGWLAMDDEEEKKEA